MNMESASIMLLRSMLLEILLTMTANLQTTNNVLQPEQFQYFSSGVTAINTINISKYPTSINVNDDVYITCQINSTASSNIRIFHWYENNELLERHSSHATEPVQYEDHHILLESVLFIGNFSSADEATYCCEFDFSLRSCIDVKIFRDATPKYSGEYIYNVTVVVITCTIFLAVFLWVLKKTFFGGSKATDNRFENTLGRGRDPRMQDFDSDDEDWQPDVEIHETKT